MNTFYLKISSSDGNLFEGEAVNLSLRGSEGDLAIMFGHISFITTVKPGDCRIELPDGTVKTGNTSGGLLTVSDNKVIFLSGNFKW